MTNFLGIFTDLIQVIRSGQLPQLGTWTYLLLAVLVAVEGPIATILGAAAASAGIMKPEWVFIAAAIGNLTADSLWYTLGYFGKVNWLLRFGKKLGVRSDVLARLESGMHEHAARILFMAKLTLSMMIPALVAAGLVKAPWRRWFPAIFSGEMLWTGSLVLIGYYSTEAIKRLEVGIEYAALGGSIVFVTFLILIGRRVLKKRYQIEAEPIKKD